MSAERAPEPTMDEILASIRRIISDEPTEQAGDTSGQFASDHLVHPDQNERLAVGSSVADDIARALSGAPKTDQVQQDRGKQLDDDIFQLTNDQVAGSADQLNNPVQEMENVLRERGDGKPAGALGSSSSLGDIAKSKEKFPSAEEQTGQDSPLQQSPVQREAKTLESTRESNEMKDSGPIAEPQRMPPDSPVVEPLESRLEVGVKIGHSQHDITDFDPEIGSAATGSSAKKYSIDDQLVQPDLITTSGQVSGVDSSFTKVDPGLETDTADVLFSSDARVDSTDINEANDILSGISNDLGEPSQSLEEAKNSLLSDELDVEPPALTSGVLGEIEQSEDLPELSEDMEKLDDNIDESKVFSTDVLMEPLPDMDETQDVSESDPDLLASMTEFNNRQAEADVTEETEQLPDLDELPGILTEKPVKKLASSPAAAVTFEQGIKDMLRPMIQNWLDENMPRLVEGAIKDELISRSDDGNQTGEE